ncbi:FecR family protein [Sphingomonas sp.]|uniref:FecR family protein n=1 Tax=Sphingomonas sp. TaxID=28214 RepID=UPI003B3BE52F
MSEPVDDLAARWALREPLDDVGQAQMAAWLAEDPRNQGALLRARAALSLIGSALVPEQDGDPVRGPQRLSRRWVVTGIGSAMAAALAGLVGWPRLMGQHVQTARGEIRRLPLADGSIATIDTGSDMRVVLASDSRRIALRQGQAWFQVAKDRKRPFIVDAGIAQVRAVGTAFSVSRTGDIVNVAVTEGTVAVWPSGADGAMNILQAGQYAIFNGADAPPSTGTAPAAIARSLAWREGEIALQDEPLSNAIAQFNRYNHQQLVIVDPDLGHERLVGLFRIDNPTDFARTLEASFGVSVRVTTDEIQLSRKKLEMH